MKSLSYNKLEYSSGKMFDHHEGRTREIGIFFREKENEKPNWPYFR